MARNRDGRRAKRKSAALRRLDDIRREWRFEPTAGGQQVLGVVVMSLGGLALGAGVYAGLILEDGAPSTKYAPFLLAGGIVLLTLYLFFGRTGASPLRVGDLGVGVEEGDTIDRLAWYQIQSVTFGEGALKLKPAGRAIVVPLALHPAAARRIAAEAKGRIPERCELDGADLGAPNDADPEVEAEPPQVTNLRCAASDTALSVEKDVRFCGTCGVVYHRKHTPPACVECGRSFARKKAA